MLNSFTDFLRDGHTRLFAKQQDSLKKTFESKLLIHGLCMINPWFIHDIFDGLDEFVGFDDVFETIPGCYEINEINILMQLIEILQIIPEISDLFGIDSFSRIADVEDIPDVEDIGYLNEISHIPQKIINNKIMNQK